MSIHIPKARNDEFPASIYHSNVRGCINRRNLGDSLDNAVLDDDGGVGENTAIAHIYDVGVGDDEYFGSFRTLASPKPTTQQNRDHSGLHDHCSPQTASVKKLGTDRRRVKQI